MLLENMTPIPVPTVMLSTGFSKQVCPNPLRCLLHTQNLVDFLGGPIAKTVFLRQEAWVQSLGRELDSAC